MVMKRQWIFGLCAVGIVALCFAAAFIEGANLAYAAMETPY
jgi:hypothetical protein